MPTKTYKIYIIGDGGHAKVIKSIIRAGHFRPRNYELKLPRKSAIAIGVGNLEDRITLFDRYRFQHPVLAVIHPTAWLAPDFTQVSGNQFMAGATVQPGCHFGDNILLNTGAQVDHDCTIQDHCVISPGAILCGGVTLGEACAIGAGAIVLEGVTLEPETKIPAGTLVVGPDDLRKPVPVVYDHGTRKTKMRADTW